MSGTTKIESSNNKDLLLIIAAVMIFFVAFSLAISEVHDLHEKEYLISYPADNLIYVKITCDIDKAGESGGVGNEWTYEHYLNDKEFKNGEVVTVDAETPFSIKSRFIEHDGISDVGEAVSKQYRYSESNNYEKTLIISQKIHVVEQGGNNAGATVDFNATYSLKRVIPDSMNDWDIFLYATNDTEYFLCVFLILGQILCVVCVIFVLITGRKEQIYIEKQKQIRIEQKLEEERQRKEREFLTGKAVFLQNLQGQSIRQAAGVPAHLSFVDGLPKDNNGAEYGSFTVYCSRSGSCYHDKIGCCSAYRPMHYFNAKKKFRPCSKCCTKKRSIPQWYINYNTIKKQAEYYQVDITE